MRSRRNQKAASTCNKLDKINRCFLSFGSDTSENISRLVSICGEIMHATCALYNRLDRELLCSAAGWNVPNNFNPVDKAVGHICYDIIRKGSKEALVIRDLPKTKYAVSDPNVRKYKLKTYFGIGVKFGDICIGSLCVVYNKDFNPTNEDKKMIALIASAIAIEEERLGAGCALKESDTRYISLFEDSPISLWEEDFSRVKAKIDLLKEEGVENFRAYFAEHPEAVAECVCLIRVIDINRTTLKFYGAKTKKEFHQGISSLFVEDSYKAAFEQLVSIAEGKTNFECETVNQTFLGEIKHIHLKWSVVPDYEDTYSKVFVSIMDITNRVKAEQERESINKELARANERLKKLIIRDPHTGLYNQRYLEDAMEVEFARAKRFSGDLSVIVLDIDYFKSVNELYGHAFGDVVIKQFAKQLKQQVRQYDILIRIDGEQFLVILPQTEQSQALEISEGILDSINVFNFGDNKHTVKLTLSIGISSYPYDKVLKGMDLVALAEKIMSKAKDEGGNRILTSEGLKDGGKGASIKNHVKEEVKTLQRKLNNLHKHSRQSIVESIFAFAKTIELKDHYTGEHVEKTVHYATELAKKLDLAKNEVEIIRQASMLHDLGKVGVSDNILLKRSKLTVKEYIEIKKHPQIAADILRPIQLLHDIIPLIYYHHERWDGKGYPSGIKGEEIPMGARIISVADAFQALISDRPYRKAYNLDRAMEILRLEAGSKYDPKVIESFMSILKKEKPVRK